MRRRRRDGSCLYEGIEGYSDGNKFDSF
jgi:hypothetical protein